MKGESKPIFVNRVKGSFTVEITLLMPIILMIMLLFLYFIFLLYNRSVMQAAVCRGTKQIFYCSGLSNTEMKEECTKVILADLEGRLICMSDVQVIVKIGATKAEAYVNGELNVPELFVLEGTNLQDLWFVEVNWSEPCRNAAETIRMFQQAQNIYDTVTENEDEEMEALP